MNLKQEAHRLSKQRYILALAEITAHYGDRKTERSNVPLINHILEGCAIIYERYVRIGDPVYGFKLMAAFCLHPLAQAGITERKYCHNEVIEDLAKRYAVVANHYLCRPENEHIKDSVDLSDHLDELGEEYVDGEVMVMLYANKVQQKHFYTFYKDMHPNAEQLERYFDIWIDYLQEWL